MKSAGFEEVEHTADWALRVWGEDLDQLLVHAAQGMLKLVGAAPEAVTGKWRKFELEALDREGLLVSWLEELLFLLETKHVTFSDFKLKTTSGTHLLAEVLEKPVEKIIKDIKAVTYHGLEIRESHAGLEVTIVFDV